MAQLFTPIPGIQSGETVSLGSTTNVKANKPELLYDPDLLRRVLSVKNQDDVMDESGAPNIRTMEPPRVKSKTVYHHEVAALEPDAYAQFVRDALKKLSSYSKTVNWFTRQITQASANGQCLSASFNGEPYEFGRHDISHIQKLYQNALSNLKIAFRTSKKTVRKSKSGTASTNVYGKLCMSQPFQNFASHFVESLRADLTANLGHYQQLSRNNSESVPVKIVDDEMTRKAIEGTNYFGANSSLLSKGFVRKLTASSAIYIAGYISNITKLRATNFPNLMESSSSEEDQRLRAQLLAMTVEELKEAKKKYLGGTFAAPDYMKRAFGKGANWNPDSYAFGKHNHTHSTCKIVQVQHDKYPNGTNPRTGFPVLKYSIISDPNNPNTVFEEMKNAKQVDSAGNFVDFSENAISMNLVGRIVSLVTFAAKDKAKFAEYDPNIANAFAALDSSQFDNALAVELKHMIDISHFYRRVHSFCAFDRSQSLKYITSVITSKSKKKTKKPQAQQ